MELGATVCTPRAPSCLTCPVVELCATRGEMDNPSQKTRQKKREIHYALDCRDGKVFLVQRARDARLMAGMWELPEVEASVASRNNKSTSHSRFSFTLRHSITVTDYTVTVWPITAPKQSKGKWVAVERLEKIALTGLARKILRKAFHPPRNQRI
jgi:A/G-specific adenine glycosylase